jgi:hypothetical protein
VTVHGKEIVSIEAISSMVRVSGLLTAPLICIWCVSLFEKKKSQKSMARAWDRNSLKSVV